MNISKMYQIKVDGEVYNFLKQNAEPFEDTPNSVLRRYLPLSNKDVKPLVNDIPEFRPGVPSALEQVLQVLHLTKNKGYNRLEATRKVADVRGITYQAVIDKYTRQLGKNAYEIDQLLSDPNMTELKRIIKKEFPLFTAEINKILGG